MRIFVIFLLLPILANCASWPKNVSDAWREYRGVRVGMTAQEVHALLGSPTYRSLSGPYTEDWIVGERAVDAYAAYLRVIYDRGPDDGRVQYLYRGRQRPKSNQ